MRKTEPSDMDAAVRELLRKRRGEREDNNGLGELRSLYELACANVCRDPDDRQFAVWEAVLRKFPYADVEQALGKWWSNTTPIYSGGAERTEGSFMPTPADLLPAIYRAREQRRESERFKPCNRNGCIHDGWKQVQNENGEFKPIPCECRLTWEAAHGIPPE